MKTNAVIDNEVAKLTSALKSPHWSHQARHLMNQQINVLVLRLTPQQVEDRYYEDETTEDYKPGDNDLWMALDAVARWTANERGVAAPSKGL